MLERNDYVKANKNLIKKVNEAAEILTKKMDELNLGELHLSIGVIYLRSRKTSFGVYEWVKFENGGDLTLPHSKSNGCDGKYLYGDFNNWQEFAASQEFLDFANSWQEIKEVIDNIETEKTAEIINAYSAGLNEEIKL